CESVDADAEPSDSVTTRDTDQTEQQNDHDAEWFHSRQHAEVKNDHDGDERFENQNELTLRRQVRLAGGVDQLGNLAHGAVHRQFLEIHVNRQAETEAENADSDAKQQQIVAVNAVQEGHLLEIREHQTRFASLVGLRVSRDGKSQGCNG